MENSNFKYSTIQYPSIKQHGNKHLAFIDPSKTEEDKFCEEYLKEMIELNRELNLRAKPYNKVEIQRSDLITTSMKTEVALKNTIQDLIKYNYDPVQTRYLKEEQEQAEKRARRHYIIFQDNLYMAHEKDKFYKKRPYLSHGTYLKLLIILQCNLSRNLRSASESMEKNGLLCLLLYTFFYIFIGIPVQFAMRTISQYSKNTVITMWNFCPVFKGAGFMMLISALYYMLLAVAYSSILFYMLFDTLKGNIGWATCAGVIGKCYDKAISVDKPMSCTNKKGANNSLWSLIPCTGISYYRTVVETSFNGYEESLKWDGLLYLFLVWFITLIFTIVGFQEFIKIANTLFFPVIVTGGIVLIVVLSNGQFSSEGLKEFLLINLDNLDYVFAHMMFSDVFFDCMVSNGIINFLTAHAPHNVDPMVDAYIFAITDLTIKYSVTFATFTAAGYLQYYYNTINSTCFLVYRDVTMMSVIPEFLAHLKLGKLWIFLYLMYALLSHLVFIIIVTHMTVDSLTDTLGLETASSTHSSLIFLLIGCGFTFNVFFNFAHNAREVISAVFIVTTIAELNVVFNFIIAIVCMYSSSNLCKNVYLITNCKPSSYCEFSLKFSLVSYLLFGMYYIVKSIDKKFEDTNWSLAIKLLLVIFIPWLISVINRISTVFQKPATSLFGCDSNWGVNWLMGNVTDPTKPRYQKNLICTHRCLRQFMFSYFEEARMISLRKCFAVAYAPQLYEQAEM